MEVIRFQSLKIEQLKVLKSYYNNQIVDLGLPGLSVLTRPTIQIDKSYQYPEPGLSIICHCAVNVIDARQEAKTTLSSLVSAKFWKKTSLQHFLENKRCDV